MITKYGINVQSYVHTADGIKNTEELTPEQKKRLSGEISCILLNGFYAGKVKFRIAEETK